MYRRLVVAFAALAMLAAVCSGDAEPDSTTSTLEVSTSTSPSPSTTTASSSDFAAEFEPELVEELVALESANNGEWTVDNAVKAWEMLLPSLQAGVDGYPPISIMGLRWFLAEHADELTGEQQQLILGASEAKPNALPAVYRATDEDERAGYQRLAEQASDEFARLTGYEFPGRIVVALSDYGLLAGEISALASTQAGGFDLFEGFNALFATNPPYERLVELFEDATAGGGVACVIIMGEVFRARTVRQQTAGIMHEVTHCHQQAIHPGGVGRFYATSTLWMDEGYAAWAGEFFVGGTVPSRVFWNRYHDGVGPIGGHDPVDGSYDGIALFSYLHDNGIEGWGNFERYFGGIRADGDDRAKLTTILGLLPEDALVKWAATSLRRPDLSVLWDYTTGPGIANSTVSRMPREIPMVVDLERSFSTAPGEQGTYALEPVLGDAGALLFEFEMAGPGVVRWPWGEDQTTSSGIKTTYCFGDECVCDDGRELGPIAPAFTESNAILLATTGGSFTAVLVEPEDPCEEEEVPVPSVVGVCPIGIWAAEPEEVADLLLTLYRDFGIADPDYEGGPINMTFFEDGSYRFDYVDTTFTEVIEGINTRFVLNGGSFGTWEVDGSTLTVALEGQDIVLDVYLDGSGKPGVTVNAPSNTGGGSTDYVCNGNDQLIIDPSFSLQFWPYPRGWTRVNP